MENMNNMENDKIFRYKFSEEVNELIIDFSRGHMYDNKKILIDQYDTFWEENIDIFNREERRLNEINFNQELKTAIFRSIKYYHIKKMLSSENKKEKEKNETVRDYIKLNKFIIQYIDGFIIDGLKKKGYKPSKNYEELCLDETFKHLLIDEKVKVINKYKQFLEKRNESKTKNEIEEWWDMKIKKTHKNRYFSIKSYKKKSVE